MRPGRGQRPEAVGPRGEIWRGPEESISLALGRWEGGVLVVTSAETGEGVSTVSRRLADVLATRPFRALLIDADLRDPTQHDVLGITRGPGLTDVAVGECSAVRAIRSPHEGGAALLPAGTPTGEPIEILELPRIKLVMSRLRAAFKWVVLDCPAVSAHTDAVTLGGMADGIVLVVEAEKTKREVVEETRAILERSSGRVLGAILNRRRYYIPEALYRFL